ncbi:MAG: homoserine dehydrogenase [Clostridia bacterium]|nr:homoserine dehydrogenase [Clostridia bacterium]
MKVAILGIGTVGSGAYDIIRESDCGLTVARVLDRYVPEGLEGLVTTNYDEILGDPEIKIVAEAIGGLHPAYEFVTAALRAGKHVVSANKHLICHYYRELHELARENGVKLRFTPSAGGGIPWLFNLRRARRCDEIESLRGIMNGTTNYILDSMQNLGSDFAEVLAVAQSLGYAEADPSADIDGWDVRRKCAISASIAYDTVLGEDDVPTFGIRTVTAADIAYFKSMGLCCKLLAFAKKNGNEVTAYVEPTLLPADATEASVGSNFNCISLWGKYVGRLSFIGQGAGKYPTGHALVEDMLDIRDDVAMKKQTAGGDITVNADRFPHRYYIRTTAKIADGLVERRDGDVVITRPLSPAAMHKAAAAAADIDPLLFIAGLEDSVE